MNLATYNNIHLLYHSGCGSGVQAWIGWALCFRVSSESGNQGVGQGCSLTSRFDWARNPFQVHMIVGSIHFLQAVRLRTSVSSWLSLKSCSQFLDLLHRAAHNMRDFFTASKESLLIQQCDNLMWCNHAHAITLFLQPLPYSSRLKQVKDTATFK